MASADRPTLFINATVLDGSEHMEPQPDMAVAVERGIITWMGPSAVAQAPAGAEVIDLAGAYLMPGLINMHVHLCGSGKPVSAGDAGALMKKLDNPVGRAIVRHILKGSAQQQLASGVTTVRGAGDPLFADIAVRDAIDAGKYQGPRLVAPGTGVTVPDGHGAGLFAQVASSPAEAAEQVRDLYARCRCHQVVRDGWRVRCDRSRRARRAAHAGRGCRCGMQGGARGWPSGHGPCREHRRCEGRA